MRYTNPNDIKTDHLSGASALTVGGLQAVIEYFKNTDTVLPEKLREDFHAVWKDIVDAQPFMASLRSAYGHVHNAVDSLGSGQGSAADFKKRIIELLTGESRTIKRHVSCLGKNGSSIMTPNMRILTYSRSGSVERIFHEAHKERIPFSVVLSEARPNNEGTEFAKALARKKIPVTLVIDVNLYHYIASAQCLMLGADWISETQFTNKIGSALLVQLALEQKIPVYVAASTDKTLAQKFYPITVDDQPPGEILTTHNTHLTVKNRFFEAVPLSDEIDFITERGIVKHETLKGIIDRQSDHG